jgi:hypothetical protein
MMGTVRAFEEGADMGWLTLRQFVKLDKDEIANLQKNGPLPFGTLKKLVRAVKEIENGLNDHFDNPDKVDRTSAIFGKEFSSKPYKFGHLITKLRKLTNEKQWLAEMEKFEKENPAKYQEMTSMFAWLMKPESGPTAGGRKANFRIKFKLDMGGRFNPVVERFEHNPRPTREKRKYHVDLKIDFD